MSADALIESNNKPPEKELTAYSLCKMNCGASPILVDVKINMIPVTMELDTCLSLSIMSESTFNSLWSGYLKPPLIEAEIQICTYTGELVDICGTIDVNVSYNNTTKCLLILIVSGACQNMFGHDWL